MTEIQSHQADGVITMTKAEWLSKGKELFGEDVLKWRFICPSCGHIQTIDDFRPFKDKGAEPSDAYFNCIGRFDGVHGAVSILSGESPCNYTSGGLFCLNKIKVIDGEKETWVFAFDEGRSHAQDS